jgi:hypothetical protein
MYTLLDGYSEKLKLSSDGKGAKPKGTLVALLSLLRT